MNHPDGPVALHAAARQQCGHPGQSEAFRVSLSPHGTDIHTPLQQQEVTHVSGSLTPVVTPCASFPCKQQDETQQEGFYALLRLSCGV